MGDNKSILLVEDDQVDIMTVERAIKEVDKSSHLHVVNNGEEALSYLENKDNEYPDIILLDLNMPRMSGIEFLKIIKQRESLKRVPVVVLTTSKEEQDKTESFTLGVAGYMIKPIDYKYFVDMIKTVDLYWTMSELPD